MGRAGYLGCFSEFCYAGLSERAQNYAMEQALQDRSRATLAAQRDARLERARSLTRWAAGVAAILVGLFAGLVAQAHPGRHLQSTSATTAPAQSSSGSSGSSGDGSALAPPSDVPAQTQAPPIIQSGGS